MCRPLSFPWVQQCPLLEFLRTGPSSHSLRPPQALLCSSPISTQSWLAGHPQEASPDPRPTQSQVVRDGSLYWFLLLRVRGQAGRCKDEQDVALPSGSKGVGEMDDALFPCWPSPWLLACLPHCAPRSPGRGCHLPESLHQAQVRVYTVLGLQQMHEPLSE